MTQLRRTAATPRPSACDAEMLTAGAGAASYGR